MDSMRSGVSVCVLNNRIYAIGGEVSPGKALAKVSYYRYVSFVFLCFLLLLLC
jgi:N-acetylneuraminic acid mutarotase